MSLTMMCKVCQDAGKSESVYRSHFIRESRDPNSRVVCPTLLELECRFCHKNGHTVKYCPVLKQREQQQHPQPLKKRAYIIEDKMPEIKKKNNVFACLDSDEDEEQEQEQVRFPEFCRQISVSVNKMDYANALAKPKQEEKALPKIKVAAKQAPWATATTAKRNWADDTDSEDEDDA